MRLQADGQNSPSPTQAAVCGRLQLVMHETTAAVVCAQEASCAEGYSTQRWATASGQPCHCSTCPDEQQHQQAAGSSLTLGTLRLPHTCRLTWTWATMSASWTSHSHVTTTSPPARCTRWGTQPLLPDTLSSGSSSSNDTNSGAAAVATRQLPCSWAVAVGVCLLPRAGSAVRCPV